MTVLAQAVQRLPTKDTFESLEHFSQRFAAALGKPVYGRVALGDLLVFSVPLPDKGNAFLGFSWLYDADQERVRLDAGLPVLGPIESEYGNWYPVCSATKLLSQRTYPATNTFGVKVTVTELHGERTCAMVKMPNWHLADATQSLARDVAREELKNPTMQIVGRLMAPYGRKNFDHSKPTLASPQSTSMTSNDLYIRPLELRLVGSREKRPLVRVRFTQTEDVLTDTPEGLDARQTGTGQVTHRIDT